MLKTNIWESSHILIFDFSNYAFHSERTLWTIETLTLFCFFNNGSICFIINIYSDHQQNTLKYLKDIKINISNILIMIGDFNIRNNNWDLSYPHHLSGSQEMDLASFHLFFFFLFSIFLPYLSSYSLSLCSIFSM